MLKKGIRYIGRSDQRFGIDGSRSNKVRDSISMALNVRRIVELVKLE